MAQTPAQTAPEPTQLRPQDDLVTLLRAVVDVESVSGNEAHLADLVEQLLSTQPHLQVDRDGDTVIARTSLHRPERIVIAGHLDTVPVAGNLPSWIDDGGEAGPLVYGRGTCDMKGGVAVALKLACELQAPERDLTWIFYDNEEVEATKNGLGRVARTRPELLAGDFAVLMEPTGAVVEGGCQGTLRFEVHTRGRAAHSARSWLGHNAIHDLQSVLATIASFTAGEVMVDGLAYHEGLNAVKVTGGIAGNVIPDHAVVEVNYRFAPDKTLDQARTLIAEHFAGFEIEFTDGAPGARPGLDAPPAASFVTAVGGTARAKYGWTDVARFSEFGIPAVNFGPADPGKAHADDEFCPAADLDICYQALHRWLAPSQA